jgi:hypothetical protein
MFKNRSNPAYNKFEQDLLRYISIVAPLIRSLWSLEAAHANAADVLVFWLASAATLRDLFSKGPDATGIPISLANNVIMIVNTRFEKFFVNDIYFTAFALDPRM